MEHEGEIYLQILLFFNLTAYTPSSVLIFLTKKIKKLHLKVEKLGLKKVKNFSSSILLKLKVPASN